MTASLLGFITSETVAAWRRKLEARIADADLTHATAPLGTTWRVVLTELNTADDGATAVPSADADTLLTVEETAKRLRMSERTVRRLCRRWTFTRRLGRSVRISSKGLERWLTTQGGMYAKGTHQR